MLSQRKNPAFPPARMDQVMPQVITYARVEAYCRPDTVGFTP